MTKVVTGPTFQQVELGDVRVAPLGMKDSASVSLGAALAGTVSTMVPVTGLVATPSGVQGTALLLPGAINTVDTVGTAADAVKLPLAVAGLQVIVSNTTVTSMQVFGSGTDTINGVATATGVAQAGGLTALYVCTVSAPAGKWRRLLSA